MEMNLRGRFTAARVCDAIARTRNSMCLLLLAGVVALPALASDFGYSKFTPPTPEELALKEVPGVPNAPAIVLFREQITRDDLHVVQHYDRIKVLSEAGKKYATVELRYISVTDTFEDLGGDGKTMGGVSGRTIHADGTIVPFTGKPYRNTIEKEKGLKYQALVFTLPDVEIGSILEYRYDTRINDNIYESPTWLVQGDLYVQAAHYAWFPTARELQSDRGTVNSISWFPILPTGAKVEHTELPGVGSGNVFELKVKDVPPQVHEDFMPPIASYSYRVSFYYSAYRSVAEFWKGEGKNWSKRAETLATPNGDLRTATDSIIAGATTSEEKLKRIYATVMKFENTEFTRQKEANEEKAAGTAKLNNAYDVFKRERGTPVQLTDLFVAMARAAGFKAYLMLVPDRSIELFIPTWLTFDQFDATIAVVNVDGKDVFFDPGERDCPYGALSWQHTLVDGLREVDGGTAFARTPEDSYKDNRTSRIANLHMDDHGQVTGPVTLTFSGAPALSWRQRSLKGDDESVKMALRQALEAMVPNTLEVTVSKIENLDAYEKPLIVTYAVKGTLGSATGKRLLMPLDLFESTAPATFPHEKRELPVYFKYPEVKQDAVRIFLPKTFEVEGVPDPAKFSALKSMAYGLSTENNSGALTIRRDLVSSGIVYLPAEYGDIRKFFTQVESTDRGQVIVKVQPTTTASVASPGN